MLELRNGGASLYSVSSVNTVIQRIDGFDLGSRRDAEARRAEKHFIRRLRRGTQIIS